MTRNLRFALPAAALVALGGTPLAAADALADERSSYSYVRTLDGRATLASASRAAGETVGANEPLLQGDRITVERGARLEIVLADRNLLRVGGGSILRLARVAFSADRDDRTTRIDLDQGEILLDVSEEALGDELPEIRTPDGTVFIHQPGRYRLIADRSGGLQLTVREGYAELLTDRGSTVVRAGEEAWTTGDRWGSVELAAAGPRGALERWAEELEVRTARASRRELRVAPHLAYSASSLDDYGSWVYVDTSWYWRPRVGLGWRPYWDGRWAWTPSGLTWVSHEPWGWVPYHYGSWTILPGYGWAWQPGYRYSPAWVYWYVGPSWTGWCPVGYYTHHYRGYWRTGFRFGIYGWTGGSWGFYADWSFLPSRRLLDRHGRDWRRTGSHLGRTHAGDVPRGILTTDTGPVPREQWERPDDVVRTLVRRGGPRAGSQRGGVPDVTDFVARRPGLPPEVEHAVTETPGARLGTRRGSPLDPGTVAIAPRETPTEAAGWRRGARSGPPGGHTGAAGVRSPNRGESTPRWGGVSRGDQPRVDAAPPERLRPSAERRDRDEVTSPTRGGTIGDRRSDASDRQGWRRSRGSEAPSATPWSSPRSSRGADQPVTRVIDGVRRFQPRDAGSVPSPSRATERPTNRLERPSQPRAGATSPSAPPTAGWRGNRNASPPKSGANAAPSQRSTPPQAAPASPPPGRGSRAAATSDSQRRGNDRSAAKAGGNSSGQSRSSKATQSSRSQRSKSSSSPPPKRRKSGNGVD